jgi:hypothetical protein
MKNEEIAYIKGYRVDEEGNVYGLSGQKLIGWITRTGYHCFRIGKNIANLKTHRLAAYQWFGDAMFEVGIEVRHLDGNPLNNVKTNLALGTASQNAMDKLPETRLRAARIAARVVRKLTDAEAIQLRNDRNNGMSYDELKEKYGISSKSTISYIVNNKTYSYLPE